MAISGDDDQQTRQQSVDAKMCKLIVPEQHQQYDRIQADYWSSTRLLERLQQTYFTIMDFRNASGLFSTVLPLMVSQEVDIDLGGDGPVDEPEIPTGR